jgi:predicted amidophosphoribosyltransferase
MNLTRIGYRMRYYWRKTILFIGLCPRCFTSVNFTRQGRPICPKCGR